MFCFCFVFFSVCGCSRYQRLHYCIFLYFRAICAEVCVKKVLLLAEYRHMYCKQAERLGLLLVEKSGLMKLQWRLYRPFSLGYCYSFFQFRWYHCQCCYCGGGVLFVFFFFWCELAPSPGLLWYDSYTAASWIFPLNADLHFSQAKGGAAPTVCMILMMMMMTMMMLRVVMMIFMLGVLNEWMWHWLAETSNIFNLN